MDPYVRIRVGSQSSQTQVAQSAGKHPTWSDRLMFKKTTEDIVNFEVWDRDRNSRDDLVGSGAVSLAKLYLKGNKSLETVQLVYKGRNAGQLQVEIELEPDRMLYGQQMGMLPQQAYVQQGFQQQMIPQQVMQPQYQQIMPQQMMQPQHQQVMPQLMMQPQYQQVIPQQAMQPQYPQVIPQMNTQQMTVQPMMMPQQGYAQPRVYNQGGIKYAPTYY